MNYDKYFLEGEGYYIKRNFITALELFKDALRMKRTNDCLNYIGCCYLELNVFQSAIEIFQKLYDDNPDWERPALNLGRAFLRCKNFEKALIAFKEAEKRNPYEEDVYFYLGVYYFKTEDYLTAKEYYEKSIAINDKQAETHLNLGRCYSYLDMNDKAIQEFDYAYRIDNDCLDAIYNKGILLLSMNKYKEALENLLLVNKLDPNDVEVMVDIAHCYFRTKDKVNANAWVNKVITIEPQHKLANSLLKKIMHLT